jgi:nitrogenase-associated protein
LATVLFYEKPGCGANARQKRMLEAAGHTIIAGNLLTEPWTAERLRDAAAPRVKSGEIDPESIEAPAALALMLNDPLLIRRPLVEAGSQRCAGFDREPVISLLGKSENREDVQGCGRREASSPCLDPRQSQKTSVL